MASATALYTPELLALATDLARYPLTDDLPVRGHARSPSCGSTLELGIQVDGGRIARVGMRSHACAVGQAAAAIFAANAIGKNRTKIAAAEREIASWLGGSALPDWPGIAAIATVADYPGRHGAVLLPWRAALSALPSGESGG